MTLLIDYWLRANLLLGLFYGCYWLLMRRHTFLNLNRAYLVGTLLLAWLLPLLPIPSLDSSWFWPGNVPAEPLVSVGTGYVVAANVPNAPTPPDWPTLLSMGVLGVALLLLARTGWQVWRLWRQIEKWPAVPKPGYTLVLPTDANVPTFSFLRYLVLNPADAAVEAVRQHELVHIRQWHSLDVLLTELVQALYWPNPAMVGYRRAIRQVHEFLADDQAMPQTSAQREAYIQTLVDYAFNLPVSRLAHSFTAVQPNSPTLKQRIQMLTQQRTHGSARWKYALVIPLATTLMALTTPLPESSTLREAEVVTGDSVRVSGRVLDQTNAPLPGATVVVRNGNKGASTDADGRFQLDVPVGTVLVASFVGYTLAEQTVSARNPRVNFRLRPQAVEASAMPTEETPVSLTVPASIPNEKVYNVVERTPTYLGGLKAMYAFLGSTLKYPKEAIRRKVQGKVFVNFVVQKDGSLSNFKVLKGIGAGCDEEAVRVMRLMPNWQPGIQNGKPVAVMYNLPIQFQLSEGKRKVGKRTVQAVAQPEPVAVQLATLSELKNLKPFKLEPANTPFRFKVFDGRDPLVLVEGKPIKVAEINDIDPNTIESINVMKGDMSAQHGPEAKDGVVLITLKK